jgi:hypothetical protein
MEFETLLTTEVSAEAKRDAFMRLMTLLLGSTTDWTRADTLSDKLGIPVGTTRRYTRRVSAPLPFVFPLVTTCLKEILEAEYAIIEKVLAPLEKAAEEKRAAQECEWQEFVARVCNPLPGTSLNCQVSYRPPETEVVEFPLELLFAYPCRGIYELSNFFPHICSVCEASGKEVARTHGRVILSSEDGLLMLPHIIYAQADLMQVVEDVRVSDKKERLFVLENDPLWYDKCKTFLASSDVVKSLPPGDVTSTQARDLSKDKLVWCM